MNRAGASGSNPRDSPPAAPPGAPGATPRRSPLALPRGSPPPDGDEGATVPSRSSSPLSLGNISYSSAALAAAASGGPPSSSRDNSSSGGVAAPAAALGGSQPPAPVALASLVSRSSSGLRRYFQRWEELSEGGESSDNDSLPNRSIGRSSLKLAGLRLPPVLTTLEMDVIAELSLAEMPEPTRDLAVPILALRADLVDMVSAVVSLDPERVDASHATCLRLYAELFGTQLLAYFDVMEQVVYPWVARRAGIPPLLRQGCARGRTLLARLLEALAALEAVVADAGTGNVSSSGVAGSPVQPPTSLVLPSVSATGAARQAMTELDGHLRDHLREDHNTCSALIEAHFTPKEYGEGVAPRYWAAWVTPGGALAAAAAAAAAAPPAPPLDGSPVLLSAAAPAPASPNGGTAGVSLALPPAAAAAAAGGAGSSSGSVGLGTPALGPSAAPLAGVLEEGSSSGVGAASCPGSARSTEGIPAAATTASPAALSPQPPGSNTSSSSSSSRPSLNLLSLLRRSRGNSQSLSVAGGETAAGSGGSSASASEGGASSPFADGSSMEGEGVVSSSRAAAAPPHNENCLCPCAFCAGADNGPSVIEPSKRCVWHHYGSAATAAPPSPPSSLSPAPPPSFLALRLSWLLQETEPGTEDEEAIFSRIGLGCPTPSALTSLRASYAAGWHDAWQNEWRALVRCMFDPSISPPAFVATPPVPVATATVPAVATGGVVAVDVGGSDDAAVAAAPADPAADAKLQPLSALDADAGATEQRAASGLADAAAAPAAPPPPATPPAVRTCCWGRRSASKASA